MNDIADCVSTEASPAVPLHLQRRQFSINIAAPTQIEPLPLRTLVAAAPAHTEAAHTESLYTETKAPAEPAKFVARQPETYNYWKELEQNEHLRKMRR